MHHRPVGDTVEISDFPMLGDKAGVFTPQLSNAGGGMLRGYLPPGTSIPCGSQSPVY
jgi:hypothetical protein